MVILIRAFRSFSRPAGHAVWVMVAGLIILYASPATADFREGLFAYERGDYQEAFRAWKPAAAAGNSDAQAALGSLYLQGLGTEADYKEAAKWIRLAAEQGNPNAQFQLATLYYQGLGLPRSNIQSLMWFEIATRTFNGSRRIAVIAARDQVASEMGSTEISIAKNRAAKWREKSRLDQGFD